MYARLGTNYGILIAQYRLLFSLYSCVVKMAAQGPVSVAVAVVRTSASYMLEGGGAGSSLCRKPGYRDISRVLQAVMFTQ